MFNLMTRRKLKNMADEKFVFFLFLQRCFPAVSKRVGKKALLPGVEVGEGGEGGRGGAW